MFCRFIAGMRAEVALLRFGLMAGAGIRLALCALIFALAAAVAEAQAQTAAPVDECAAGTDTCGATHLCGDTETGFTCGQECPNGFVHGSTRTECAESCDFPTHIRNADNECTRNQPWASEFGESACAQAGWTVTLILREGVTPKKECPIPYRNATTQTDESGCWLSSTGLEGARFFGQTTASRHCWELFDLHGLPSFADHSEGDRYVHTCPDGKEPSADLKSCVCPSGFTTNTDGTCADIDECAADANTCGAGGVCTNTIGGHACACNIGYAQASAALASPCDEDIDECALGTHTCGHNTCENTVGGFTCAPVDECALGTDTCGETNICGDAPDGFICGQECPNGFVHGSNRTECAETCDTATHMINADNECVLSPNTEVIRTARQQCALAGWQWNFITSTLTVGLSLGQECPIPYRNATTQTDEGGCWISDFSLEKAQREGGATATQYCHNLFDLHGIPSLANHSEGDRYVYNCPDGREPSADLKTCVCSSGYVENRAGTCVDINECISDANTCEANAQCVNTVGGHACLCETGYAASSNLLENPQCADIDECAMGTHNCGQNDICENTVGGFECTLCPAGFEPGADGSECVSACAAGLERWPNGGECVSVCPPGETRNEAGACFCNTETHLPNPCRLQTNSAIQICQGAGWMTRNITDEYSYLLGQICDIPYRDATAQTDEEGCFFWLRLNPASAARLPEYTTAVHPCSDLFSGADIPQAANHNEGDRYVHTCPSGRVVSDDFKSCACPAGYSDISGTCVDINECGDGTHACGEGGVCANTRGSYTCSCADGYQSESADTLQCSDVDECEAGTDTCGANTLCANTVGGFVCGNECPPGTAPNADRSECADICLPGETLDDSGTCVCNTETHLPNPCRPKAETLTQTCSDSGWTVRDYHAGLNHLGAVCEIPYRDATAGSDENGCFLWWLESTYGEYTRGQLIGIAHWCRDLFAAQPVPTTLNHNTGDRYVHTCPAGKFISADLKSCVGCSGGKVLGADGCVCPAGHAENDEGVCADIDECATGAHSCGDHENASCVNTEGGHICACDAGYAPSGDGWTLQNPQCADVDECAMETDDCGENSLCENTVGGFVCGKICADGLFPNPDRSECATSPCPAYHKLETAGLLAGQCVCDEEVAIQLSESGDACVPLTGISTVQRCADAGWNIIEFFTNPGFTDVECEIPIRDATREVDESGCYLIAPDNSALDNYVTTATKHCSSVFGSGIPMSVSHNAGERYHHSCPGVKIQSADYKSCVCPAEYAENDEGECVDMDECAADAHSCGERENAVCVNTVGGHACACGAGYAPGDDWTFLDPMCEDVDECAAGTDDCGANALCGNTVGGYLCGKTCPDGLQPNADRTECVPCPTGQTQDETGACVCDPETRFVNTGYNGACHLTSSAVTDICRNAGWLVMTVSHDNNSAMGAVCQIPYRDETAQVDETGCSLWRNFRHADNSHWDDYQTTSQRCRDLFDLQPVPLSLNYNEGDRYVHSCPAPKTPSADLKSCECPAGYADDGAGNCVDINECETDAHTCGANAACVNTPGSHACSCSAGYAPVGDSLQNLQCADIDECVMGAHSCGGQDNAYCANTVGDYECSCYVDHLPLNPDDPKNPQCQGSFALTLSSPARGTLYAEYEGVTLNVGVNYAPQGATVSVKAQPDAGYYLLKWGGDCANLSAAEPHERGLPQTCKLIANEERQVSATFERAWQAAFEPQPANGTLSARIKDGETLQSGDIAREGTTVIFTAAPASGYYLLEWGGHCAGHPAAAPRQRGLSQTCELTLNAETTVAATFERAWQTTFNSESNGTLSAQIKDGITLRSGDIVREGTTIIYTAQPDSGFYLLKWGGACADQLAAAPGERGLPKTCELIADATRKVAATFERAWQTTFNSQPPNGTLSARVKGGVTLRSGDIVREGTTVIYTALPDPGHYLLNWTGHCKQTPAAAPSEHGLPKECELIADEARQVGAAFARAGEITFNPKPPNGALSAQVQDGKTLRPNDAVREGTTVIFTAQPDPGHYLLEWTDDCEDEPDAEPHERGLSKTCELSATPLTQVGATFKRAWQTTYDSRPDNGALSAETTDGETLQSSDIAQEGTTIIFTAQPDSGFYLSEWGGNCAGQSAADPRERGLPQTCQLTLTAETTVAATFERAWETTFNQPDNGTLSAEIKDGKPLRSGDIVQQGTTIIYTAQPDPGHYLLEWTDHCEHILAAAPSEHGIPKECELIADEARQVGAIFARIGEITFNPQPPNGTLSAQTQDGETLRPNDVVREGTTIIFTAQPDAGHYLLEWTGDCENEPDAEPRERGLSKTCELSATPSTQVGATFKRAWQTTFDPQPPNGALSAESTDGKTLQPGDIAQEGTTIIFTAQPDSGFYLLEWGGHCAGQPPAEPHERGLSQTCELTLNVETTVAATFKRAWQTTFDSQPPNGALSAENTDGETLQPGDIAQEGTTIIFTASPDSGFYLLEWGGHCAGQLAAEPHERGLSQTCELTLNAETTVAATFERAWETTFNQPDNGTLSAEIKDGKPLRSGDIVRRGTTIIYTAQPAPGYYLLEWTDHCEHILAAAPSEHGIPKECELIADEARQVGAIFARVGEITFNPQPPNGTLSAQTQDGETLRPNDVVREGTTVIFTAQPDPGHYLLEWTGDCENKPDAEPYERGLSKTCELPATPSTQVGATFKRAWQTTYDSQPANGALSAETTDGETLQPGDIAQDGTTIIFTAQPDSGFYLLEWGGHCAGQLPAEPHERGISQTCQLTLTAETTVAATFKRAWQTTFDSQPPNGALSAENTDGETLQPGDVAQEGTTIIFTASPDSGFYLLEWGGHCAGQPAAEPHERGLSQTCELTLHMETTVAVTFERAWETTFDQPDNGTLSAEIKDGETLRSGDIVQQGTTIIYTALPAPGHYLLEWTDHCEHIPAAAPSEHGLPKECELIADEARQVGAIFARVGGIAFNPQPPNGALSAQVKDGETLRPNDVVREGTTVIFTAQPDAGHYLLEWTGDCENEPDAEPHERGLSKTCELSATPSTQVGATFKRAWQTTFDSQPDNGALSAESTDGETLQSGDITQEGTSIIFTAQPDSGFYLLEWGGHCAGQLPAEPHERGISQTCELTLNAETTIAATFKRAWQTTYDSQPPNGALSAETTDGETLQPGDIAQEGTTIIFTAQPDSGFYLLEWGGNCAGQLPAEPHERGLSQTCELTLNVETTVAATFERAWETIFNQPDNGTLSAEIKDGKPLRSGDIVRRGTTIIYTALPAPGHYLLEWTDHCEHIPAAAPSEHGLPKECELIADEARQVGAIFARVGGIAFNPQPPNGALSAQVKDGETLRPNDVVREGTTVIFTAQPDAGHYLLEWTGDCEDAPDAEPHERGLSKTCELSATPSTQVGATFKRAWQTTFDSQPPNGALSAESTDGETLQSGDIAQEGTTIIFTASPDSGFYLLEWGGHCAGQPPAEPHERGLPQTCELTLNAETTAAATFERAWETTFSQPDNGTLSAEVKDGKTLRSGDIVQRGTTVIYTAQPDPGHYLLEWTDHCEHIPAAAPSEHGLPKECELIADEARQVGAIFARIGGIAFNPQPPNGTLSAQTQDGETLRPNDVVREGTTVIFTAQPDAGHYLLEWTGDCEDEPDAEPYERGLSKTCELSATPSTQVGATFKRAWQTTYDSQPANGTLSAQIKDGETLQSGDIAPEGTTIIFTAQPDPGFYLSEWGGHCAPRAPAQPHERGLSQTCGLTLNAETTVAATFERAWETTFSQPDNGTLSAKIKDGETLRSGDIVRQGTTIIYTAQPDFGFYLLEWTDHCEHTPAAAPSEHGLSKECELIADESREVGAVFARVGEIAFNAQPPNGTLSAQVKDGETLRPGDVVREGTTVIFTAQPDAGHYLLEWTGDCEDKPDAEPHERGLSKTCELPATPLTQVGATFKRAWQTTFDSQPPNGALSAESTDGETLQPGDIAQEGTTIIFTAQPDPGFYLSEWGGNCAGQPVANPSERGLSKTCELTLNLETTVSATFKRAWETTLNQPPNGALSAESADGKTLQSGDIASEGTTIIFTAQPDPGFYLSEWGGDCETRAPAQPHERGLPQTCGLTLNAETTVAATFERAWETTFSQPDNGTLSAKIKDGETLRSGDIVRQGTTIIYTAQPDPGFYLLEWTDHCEHIPAAGPSEHGLSKECELIADESREVGAVFARIGGVAFNTQPLNGTLSAQVKDGDILRPGDVVREGTTVIFTAQPDAGHYLLEWTGDCEDAPDAEPHERGLSKTCELSATPSTQVGATFKRAWQTTYDSQPANGTLSAQIKDGETLQSGDIAPEGTIVTFTAQPDPGFYLSEWGGHCETRAPAQPHERGLPQTCGLTLNAKTTVAATFERAWETTFSQPDNGTLSAKIKDGETLRSGDIVRQGTTIIYTAQPDPGFYLLEWTDHCEHIPAAEPSEHGLSKECELIADESREVGAVFARVGGITFNAQPPNGTLSAQVKDGDVLRPGDVVREGTTVIFTAQPDAGHYLLEWTGDCENEPDAEPHERGLSKTCELSATPLTQVGATFKRAWQTTYDSQPANGTLSAQIKDGETLQSGDIAPEGTIVTFTAQPDPGFYLSEWGGHCETRAPAQPHERGLSQTCGLTLNAETTVAATFERAWETTFSQPDNGTLSAKIKDGETLRSGDIVRQGTTVIYTAQPDPGFYLLEWTDHCEHIPAAGPSEHGLSKECELIADESREVGAVFARVGGIAFNAQPPNGTLSAQVKDGDVLRPNDVVREGTTVIFTAQPDAGHYLLEWTGDCEDEPDAEPHERGLSKTCELPATPSTQVGATFKRAWQTTYDSQPANGTLSAQIKDGETLQSGDIAQEGTTIIFTAQPDSGFYLLEWGGNCAGQLPAEPHERGLPQTCELTLHMETTVAAAFERAWQTTFNQPNNGTLSAEVKDGKTLQSGGAAREGMTVVITAQPAPGFYLLKWTGDCDGQTVGSLTLPGAAKTCELTADSQKQFGAVFERASETMFNPAPQGGRLSARIKDGAELTPGERTRAGTTIIFTARPDPRYYLLKWTGDCEGEPAADPNEREQPKECEVVAGGDPQVGAVFKLAWLVNFAPLPDHSQNGTLSARVKGGKDLRSGDAVPDGATVVFTATPNPGFYMARWTRNRAGRCGAAFANPERSPASQTCEAVVIGDSFEITPPAPEFNSSCLPIKNALGDEDNPGKCVCADPAHLIFGEGENRFCAPPTICPTNYSNKNDCIEHDANPPLPDYANSPEGCEEVFGGRRRLQTGGVEVCSGIDIQGTFCLVGSRDAFPCRGLFKHVRRCNGFHRPALNPFICGAECPGGGNTARGRYCGQETADENPNQ